MERTWSGQGRRARVNDGCVSGQERAGAGRSGQERAGAGRSGQERTGAGSGWQTDWLADLAGR